MRGFKPDVAQKIQAQNFADGGIVLGVKRFLGMDAERNARAAEYRAREAKDKQAAAQQAQAQQKPAQPSAEPARGISGYASGNGLERRMKEVDGYKNGGPVRGPGTGTSDQVPANVPEGTFIMPADSTKAIGHKALGAMGKQDIPVNLSNGEHEMTPEQVHGVGVQALNQMKDATHTPVQQGNAPAAKPEIFFANGGQVRDPNRPDIPVVGTRGPAQGAGGGGLSAQAIAAAQARQQQPAQQAPKMGIAGLTANPVTNPQGILDERMKRAGFAAGGVVENSMNPIQPAPVAAAPAVASPVVPGAAPVAAVPGASPAAAVPAAPMGWQERNDQRNTQVTASSIVDSPERAAAQASLAKPAIAAVAPAVAAPVVPEAPARRQALSTFDTNPVAGFFGGGSVTAEEAQRRAQEQQAARLAVGAQNVIAAQPAKPQAPVMAAPQATAMQASAPDPMAAPIAPMAAPVDPMVAHQQKLDAANAQQAQRRMPSNTPNPADGAQLSQNYHAAQQKAVGLQPSYFSQEGPMAAQNRAGAETAASSALQAMYQRPAGSAAAPALPVAPAAAISPGQPPAMANPTDQRLASGTQAAPLGTAGLPQASEQAAAQSGAAQPLPGIYRKGNSYADSVDVLAGTNTGQPNAQNMAAAQSLSDRSQQQSLARGFNPAAPQAGGSVAPIVRNSTNDWASRKALENAATAASSITANGGRFDSRRGTTTGGRNDQQILPPSDKQAAYGAMVGNDIALQAQQAAGEQGAMRENAATGRAATQEAGAMNRLVLQQGGENARAGARNALDGRRITAEEGRYALDAKAKGFDIRQAGRMEALQNEYMAAQGDPTKEAAVAKKMQVLNGKSASGEWGVQVTPPTKNADGSTTEGSIVRYNKSTGQTERVDGGQGSQIKPQPKTAAEAVAGQVYQTARGPMRWDGKQFNAL